MTNSWSGYTGSVDQIEDAIRAPYQGSTLPTVASGDAMKVTVNTGATRSVNVAGGVSWAYQVKATLDPTSLPLDPVTNSGWTRWDAVVIRRNWTAKTVVVAVVPGVAAQGAPLVVPALANNPGTMHEQLLAMVQVTSGAPLPTAIADRRAWAHKPIYVAEVGALPTPKAELFGLEATVGAAARYRCQLDASNAPAWVPVSSGYIELTGSDVLVSAAGWSGTAMSIRGLYNPYTGEVQIDLQERRSGASIPTAVSGNFPDTPVCTFAAPFRPQQTIPVFGQYAGGLGYTWLPCVSALGPSGLLTLESGNPDGTANYDLMQRPGSGDKGAVTADDISLRALIRFTRKV